MRIQIELDQKGAEFLRSLELEIGVSTHRELFNNAITILGWAVQQRKSGRIIASMDEPNKNYKELSMPVLDRIAVLSAEAPVAAAAAAATTSR